MKSTGKITTDNNSIIRARWKNAAVEPSSSL